jgi:ketosteroid isomerase-like protein
MSERRDTARAMSQENVESFKRFADANNRRDVEAMLAELDPEVEWQSAVLGSLGGEATLHRGHDGIREMLRDLYEAFSEFRVEFSDVWDLDDRVVAFGRWVTRGEESGIETTPPLASVVDFRDGKAIRVRSYLDPKDAIEAAGLRE